jgi:hypothetical protein
MLVFLLFCSFQNSVGELNLASSPLGSSLSLSNPTPSPSSEANPFFLRSSSVKHDADCEEKIESDPQEAPGDEAGRDEVDDGITGVEETAMFQERPRSETAIFREIVDDDGAQGDGFEILKDLKHGKQVEISEQDNDVNKVEDDVTCEQSRVNRYLGYIQAGMNMMAFSASVALSLIKRQ